MAEPLSKFHMISITRNRSLSSVASSAMADHPETTLARIRDLEEKVEATRVKELEIKPKTLVRICCAPPSG